MQSDVLVMLKRVTADYPRFADGRIDYSTARVCPVLNCTILYNDEVLLTHRSKNVIAYPETWNGISGFIDEIKPLENIIRAELAEEVNIVAGDILRITFRDLMIQADDAINREWHVIPVLAELARRPNVRTNWENKEAKWVKKTDVLRLPLMPFYAETFIAAMEDRL
jgi:isopentenyldiphosphate isomerase